MKTNQGKSNPGSTGKGEGSTRSGYASDEKSNMENSALHVLFINELKEIYWAEKHLVKNMPTLTDQASTDELRQLVEAHVNETGTHVARVEKVFEILSEKASPKKSEAMNGLVMEADELISETDEGTLTRDAAIISCLQKIEHYEIASYGTLRVMASTMGYAEVAEIFSATLEEEKNANAGLTKVAESFVNEHAREEKM